MAPKSPQLLLHTAPFLEDYGVTTPRLMFDVLAALFPIICAAVWFFGLSAMLILLASTLGAVFTERLFSPDKKSLHDGSAILTGLLLGLTLPPTIPLWMAFLGSVVAIGLGKSIWGGLGHNLFNPALVGRAFLQAAFPSALTTWAPPIQHGEFWALYSSNLALPFMKASSISLPIIKADAISTATPLAQIKFQSIATPLSSLISGNISGSLGETSGFLILLGGLYLLLRRTFDWRIPVSLMLTILTFSSVLYLIGPTRFPSPLFMLFSGGLLFGAIYMATDPVTSPLSPKGAWIFGIGIGILVVLIRLFGGLPEGVMYAILLMNAATPLIDRYTQPRPFGRGEFS